MFAGLSVLVRVGVTAMSLWSVALCSEPTYQCSCVDGWHGVNCERDKCYGVDCGNHGSCDPTTGTCIGSPSFTGQRCDTVVGDGFICTR